MDNFRLMDKTGHFFATNLIAWYLENKRDLPWRATQEPYRIWLSEIILQQTRVAQGFPYYLKFLKVFPTVDHLANAPEAKVLKLWQGLGYYSRARNLHLTAKMISEERKGIFPDNYKDLLKLRGVGDYTASAISSICFNLPNAVVDGNVYRVLSRVFGISTPINTSRGQKIFKQLAQSLIDKEQPGTFNQAIMEFGARYCTPTNPDCGNCVLKPICIGFKENKVAELPVKTKTKLIRKRYFNYLVVLSDGNRTILRQRLNKGIWHKLYEFPLIETSQEISVGELTELQEFLSLSETLNIESVTLYNEVSVVHKLSHQHLYTRFWIVETQQDVQNSIRISDMEEYPVPVLIENFVSEFFEDY